MAVVITKSTPITNRDAIPRVINDGRLERATSKAFQGYVNAVNGDSIASTYVMATIPTTAVVQQLYLTNAALTSGAANIGAYYPTTTAGVAGAVINAAFFASAVSIAVAATNTDVTNQSASYTVQKQDQPIWQALGLTSDPGGFIDLVITLTAALTAGGTIKLIGFYTDNGT